MAGPAGPLKLSSPYGALHFIKEDPDAIKHLSAMHGLVNQYVREALRNGKHSGAALGSGLTTKQETQGWQVPELAGYLLHERGFIVAVSGNSGKFHDNRLAQLMMPPEAEQALLAFESRQIFGRTVAGEIDAHGFTRLKGMPSWVDTLQPEGHCDTCGLPVAFLHGRDMHGRRWTACQPAEPAEPEAQFSTVRVKVRGLHLHSVSADQSGAAAAPSLAAGDAPSVAADDGPQGLRRLHELSREHFQSMSDFDFDTWRRALSRPLARDAVIDNEMLSRLETVWDQVRDWSVPNFLGRTATPNFFNSFGSLREPRFRFLLYFTPRARPRVPVYSILYSIHRCSSRFPKSKS